MSGESAERGVMDGAKRSVGRSPFRPSALARPPLHICPSSHTAYYRPSVPFPSPPTENYICTGAPSSVDLSSCVNLGPGRMYVLPADLREAFLFLFCPSSSRHLSFPLHATCSMATRSVAQIINGRNWNKDSLARLSGVSCRVAATDSAAFIQSLSGPACVT